jgi:PcfJ-like protein
MGRASRSAGGEEPVEHTKTVLILTDGSRWVQLLTPIALDHEGAMMEHCIGRGAYDAPLLGNRAQFYSLRDQAGRAQVTIEVRAGVVRQCKGKGNENPAASFRPAIAAFIAHYCLDVIIQPDELGLLHTGAQIWPFDDLPHGLFVQGTLNLDDYGGLIRLPESMTVTSDLIACFGCGLFALPSGLMIGGDLELMYNVTLADWEGPATIEGNACLTGCTNLVTLPPGLRVGGTLDLSECTTIRELPVGLSVGGDLILPDALASQRRHPSIRIGGAVISTRANPPSINE